jgi:hypothetical protein
LAIHPSTAGRVQNLHIRTVEIHDLVAESEGKKQQRGSFSLATLEMCLCLLRREQQNGLAETNTAPETYLNSINIKLARLVLVGWLERKSCVR